VVNLSLEMVRFGGMVHKKGEIYAELRKKF
jgi:hypothetical protein